MMRDLVKGLKLIRYTYQLPQNVLAGVLFIVLGASMLFSEGVSVITGSAWLFLGLVFLVQMLSYLEVVGSVAASPKRRSIFLYVVDVITAIASVVVYVAICIAAEMLKDSEFYINSEKQNNIILLTCFWLILSMLLYMAVAFRYFVISTIAFCGMSMGSYVLGSLIQILLSLNKVQVYGIGFVLVLIGLVLNIIIRRLVYRVPTSRWALGSLRKYL